MKLIYSTDDETPSQSFRRWKDFITESMGPAEHSTSAEVPFSAKVEIGHTSYINYMGLSNNGSKSVISSSNVRSKSHIENVFVSIQIHGASVCGQDDRISKRVSGEFTVLDNRPGFVESVSDNKNLILVLPRSRLDRILGSTRRYTALTIGRNVPSAFMAASFFQNLITISERLDSDAADRLATIGVDLIVASIAERLGQDTPRSLNSTVVVQRAKTYIEDNLDDPNLDPARLAAAVGVSLRRLQQLFQERERSISDWIWRRRLEVATQRLADPGCAHRSIGELAYACGFINQAHFTRRFKSLHGLTPRDYRWRVLVKS